MSAVLKSWDEYVDLLRPAGKDLLKLLWKSNDEQYRADLYRQLIMNISYSYFQYFQSNSDHPDFMPLWNSVFMLQPNPDDVYYYAPLDGRKRYRIVGDRGTIHMLMFQFGKGLIGMVDEVGQQLSSFLNDDEIVPGPDGKFEIRLSAAPPEPGYNGIWHQIREDVDYTLVRARSYDWGNEADVRLAIECLDAPLQKRRMSIAETDERLRRALTLSERAGTLYYGIQNGIKERSGVNKFELVTLEGIGLVQQNYWVGYFEVDEGEALILETDIPKGRYWNVQTNDTHFNTVEYVYRQSSLNGHQARLDSDGKFRAVASATDPGVPNWLDTGGFTEGTFFGRWTQCESHPLPTLKRVKLADIRQHLPAETPVVSESERSELLSERRLGAQLRRRW
jgi:hypothetical protein